MFKNVLCAIDGSDHAAKALSLAIDLAKTYDSRLILAHVLLRSADSTELKRFAEIEGLTKTVGPELGRLSGVDSRVELIRLRDQQPIATGVLADIAEHLIDAARMEAEDSGVQKVAVAVLDGDPAKRILECAEQEDVDCIVMGSRGLSDIKALMLGSVSQKVAYLSPCTCITVK